MKEEVVLRATANGGSLHQEAKKCSHRKRGRQEHRKQIPVKTPINRKEDRKRIENAPVTRALEFGVSFEQSVKQKGSVCKA